MEKIESRRRPIEAPIERHRRAVKMRLASRGVDETALQCELAHSTVIPAHEAYLAPRVRQLRWGDLMLGVVSSFPHTIK
jgi:hypothetical protein